jgi:cyanophycinase
MLAVKNFIALLAFLLLQNSSSIIAQSVNAKGKLIIVGGGSMPDTMYQLFAKSIGGKDQSVVVIPTATNDSAINAGAHLTRFKKKALPI